MQVLRVLTFCLPLIFLAACDQAQDTPAETVPPTAPTLAAIGNKVVAQGGTPLSFTLSATDPKNSPLTFSMDGSVGGAHNVENEGATLGSNSGVFSWDYTTNASVAGDYVVTFTVTNATGDSDSETITITLNDGSPVMATIGNKSGYSGSPTALAFTVSATDPNGLPLTYAMDGSVGAGADPSTLGAMFDAPNRAFSWDLSLVSPASFVVKFTVTNSNGQSDSETITITVLDSSPVLATIGNKSATVGATTPISFSVSASDPNGLSLTYTMDGSVGAGVDPSTIGASFDPVSRVFTWDISNATLVPVGSYTVKFTVTNSNGQSDSETITISIQAVPTADYANGESQYGAHCQSCHGPGGRFGTATQIQCIDSATFYEKVNGGSMTGYASSMTTQDKADVLYYLNMYDASRC